MFSNKECRHRQYVEVNKARASQGAGLFLLVTAAR